MRISTRLSLIIVPLMLCPTALGQEVDIGVQQSGGVLTTGVANLDTGAFDFPTRVYTRDFAANFRALNPGVFSLAAGSLLLPAGQSALPGGADLMYDFLPMTTDAERSNLLYWDGLDPMQVDFAPAASGEFEINAGVGSGSGAASVVGGDEVIPGTRLATTPANGAIHTHPGLRLRSTELGVNPLEGIYLVALQIRMDGLQSSDPIFLAMRTSTISSEAELAAAAWIGQHIEELLEVPLAGDYNGDGFVDVADYTVWRDGFAGGDFDIDDYLAWRDNFGEGTPAASISSSAPTPEPASALLAVLGACGLPLPRGRR